ASRMDHATRQRSVTRGSRVAIAPSMARDSAITSEEPTEMKRDPRSPRKAVASRLGVPILALFLALLGLADLADAQAPVRGGTLRIGWIPAAKTLDPHLSVEFSERYVCYLVF